MPGKWSPPNEEQQEAFLEQIRDGKTRQEAAEAVGCTATKFRTFINGASEDSQAFAARYVEALEAAGKTPTPLSARIHELEGVQLAHRLLDEAIMRALDPERGKVGASNRVLHNLAMLNVEMFRPLLEARVKHVHEGHIGIYAQPQLDMAKWTIEEQEEFVALEERRNELIAKARPDNISGSFRHRQAIAQRIAAADQNGEVVEAEFEEIE